MVLVDSRLFPFLQGRWQVESQHGQGWQGPLWVTQPNPLPKQGHPEQAAQHRGQAGLEYLQRRRLHSLPGQPGPGLRHPQREEVLPQVQLELPLLQFVPVGPCPVAGHYWKDEGNAEGFGPSLKGKAALPWEIIARMSCGGWAQPSVHPASRRGVHLALLLPAHAPGMGRREKLLS